jgi:sterol desaturase/sphingolipid hydroxylase (fatty acid hydroxylase superfamily)
MSGYLDGLIAGVFIFSLGLAGVEFIWEWVRGRHTRERFTEMLASGSVGLVSALTDGLQKAVIVGVTFAVWSVTPVRLPVNGWTLIGAVLVVDLVHYWTHRWEHEVRLLWAHHSVHHSSPVYNYSTAARVAFFRVFFDAIYYAPVVLLGFHPVLVLGALTLVAVYQIWLHTELIAARNQVWRVFGLVFCTPSHHRVHHGTEPGYLDRNYGGLLIIWDRLFGTFAPEEERPTYGLTEPLGSTHPVIVHLAEYRALVRDIRAAKSWRAVKEVLLGSPGASKARKKMTRKSKKDATPPQIGR